MPNIQVHGAGTLSEGVCIGISVQAAVVRSQVRVAITLRVMHVPWHIIDPTRFWS